MKFYLLSSSHLETRLWFSDDNDFAVAMNYVAIAAFKQRVNVIAFILMSNHVHFVLECEADQAAGFVDYYKELYSLYRRRRYGDKEFLRRNAIDIQEVPLGNDSLERAVAYVQCNSVAARICVHPTGYQWGTGNAFFNTSFPQGKPVSEFSGRRLSGLLHSKQDINPEWLIGGNGYILPHSYVAVSFVESLFRSPGRYQFFLDNSSKARKVREQVAPTFSDQLILTASLNLCHSLFRTNSIEDLSPAQTVELLTQLHRRFSSDSAQLARVTGIAYKEVIRILDGF